MTLRSSKRAGESRDTSLRTLLQAWLASRGLIAVVALGIAIHQGWNLRDMVVMWDVQHYTTIAVEGYWAMENGQLMAFFPGLPLLMRIFLEIGVPVVVTGVVLSVAGSFVAALALRRLGGVWAAVLWLFAPTAVFTVIPYTESLFCAAAFWAWERARADRWGSAAVLAAAACTFRVSGLFLIGALAVLALTTSGSWRQRLLRLPWLAVPAAALAAYVVYLYALTGSWTAWFDAQNAGWDREFTWPWQSFLNTVQAMLPGALLPDHPWGPAVFRGEMVSMVVGIGVVVWCSVKRRWAEASWVGVQVIAFSISYWFFSVNRAILLWFPLWIMLATWVTWRPRRRPARVVHIAAIVLFGLALLVAMVWWCWLYFTGKWAS